MTTNEHTTPTHEYINRSDAHPWKQRVVLLDARDGKAKVVAVPDPGERFRNRPRAKWVRFQYLTPIAPEYKAAVSIHLAAIIVGHSFEKRIRLEEEIREIEDDIYTTPERIAKVVRDMLDRRDRRISLVKELREELRRLHGEGR